MDKVYLRILGSLSEMLLGPSLSTHLSRGWMCREFLRRWKAQVVHGKDWYRLDLWRIDEPRISDSLRMIDCATGVMAIVWVDIVRNTLAGNAISTHGSKPNTLAFGPLFPQGGGSMDCDHIWFTEVIVNIYSKYQSHVRLTLLIILVCCIAIVRRLVLELPI